MHFVCIKMIFEKTISQLDFMMNIGRKFDSLTTLPLFTALHSLRVLVLFVIMCIISQFFIFDGCITGKLICPFLNIFIFITGQFTCLVCPQTLVGVGPVTILQCRVHFLIYSVKDIFGKIFCTIIQFCEIFIWRTHTCWMWWMKHTNSELNFDHREQIIIAGGQNCN